METDTTSTTVRLIEGGALALVGVLAGALFKFIYDLFVAKNNKEIEQLKIEQKMAAEQFQALFDEAAKQREVLTKDISGLKLEVAQLHQQNIKCAEENVEFKIKISMLTAENKALEAKVEELTAQQDTFKTRLDEKHKNLEEFKKLLEKKSAK